MRSYTLTELFTLTRRELFALHAKATAELDVSPNDRHGIVAVLRNIRRVLAVKRPGP